MAVLLRQQVEPSSSPTPESSLKHRVIRPKHYGQWVTAGIVLVALALLGEALFTNPNIDHHTVLKYLVNGAILSGLKVTIELSLLAEAIGLVFGLVLALARISHNAVLSKVSWLYIWFFRGTPLLVQILFWGNFALLFRHLDLGIPDTHLIFLSVRTNAVITSFVAATLALGLNEAAYQAEVYRGGLLAVDPGQIAAARSLGMTKWQVNRHVVLPQALPAVLPPTGNQFISLLKASSLVSVIAGGDLLSQAENIYSTNYKTIELLIVASFWYIVLTSVTYVGQHYLEKRANRDRNDSTNSGVKGNRWRQLFLQTETASN